MSLRWYYRIAFLLLIEALAAWIMSYFLIVAGTPFSSYASYTMILSTVLVFAAILLVGFARIFTETTNGK